MTTSKSITLNQIRHYMTSPPSPPHSILVTITPDLAQEIINHFNTNNRPLKPVTLKFSDTRLLDGQNRLTACVRSKESFITHIVFGIDNDVFDRIDRGRNRTGSDILSIAGYTNTNVLSSAINWVYRIRSGNIKNRTMLQPDEMLTYVRNYPKITNFVNQGVRIHNIHGYPNGLAVAFLYIFDEISPVAGQVFANAWESGNYTKVPSFHTFNTKVAKTKAEPSGMKDLPWAVFMIITWNLFRKGRKGRQQDYSWNPTTMPIPKIDP
jgi:hypothetical protein